MRAAVGGVAARATDQEVSTAATDQPVVAAVAERVHGRTWADHGGVVGILVVATESRNSDGPVGHDDVVAIGAGDRAPGGSTSVVGSPLQVSAMAYDEAPESGRRPATARMPAAVRSMILMTTLMPSRPEWFTT
jgi:hypothetical protein